MRALALLGLSALLAAPVAGQSSGGSSVQTPASKRVLPAGSGPAWSSLSLAHQAALAPLKAHWNDIDAPRRQKWVEVAQRFPTMPLEERQRVQARMAEWATMSPTDRGRARQNFQELRSLPTEDRHARWEAYQALPPEQRQELATRALPPPSKPGDAKAGNANKPADGKANDVKTPDGTGQTHAGKRKVAVNPTTVVVKPVNPTVVQAKPGASTTLVTRTPAPPVHHQPGLPKITASAGFVNPTTLLPSRGPQGAAVVLPAASTALVRPASAAAAATAPASTAGVTAAGSAPAAASAGASAP